MKNLFIALQLISLGTLQTAMAGEVELDKKYCRQTVNEQIKNTAMDLIVDIENFEMQHPLLKSTAYFLKQDLKAACKVGIETGSSRAHFQGTLDALVDLHIADYQELSAKKIQESELSAAREAKHRAELNEIRSK